MVLKWNSLFYRLACRESKVEWIIPMLHSFEPCRRDDQAKIIEKSELQNFKNAVSLLSDVFMGT